MSSVVEINLSNGKVGEPPLTGVGKQVLGGDWRGRNVGSWDENRTLCCPVPLRFLFAFIYVHKVAFDILSGYGVGWK